MNYPLCNRTNCINWKNGRCALKDPEKEEEYCLHYEDALDFLRLRTDALKGTLE